VLNRFLCLAALLAVLTLSAPASAEIVYDNSFTPITGSMYPEAADGFYPFSFFSSSEKTGELITLAGSGRQITSFEVLLFSTEPVVLDALELLFYLDDGQDAYGAGGAPGTSIWSDSKLAVAVDGLTSVTFTVPDVEVPDSFIWAASADSNVAGLALFDPPTIGQAGKGYWDGDGETGIWYPQWFAGDPVMNFGARIEAVPEPATLVVLASAGLIMGCRRRRRHA
jgi:hypothetical protein